MSPVAEMSLKIYSDKDLITLVKITLACFEVNDYTVDGYCFTTDHLRHKSKDNSS